MGLPEEHPGKKIRTLALAKPVPKPTGKTGYEAQRESQKPGPPSLKREVQTLSSREEAAGKQEKRASCKKRAQGTFHCGGREETENRQKSKMCVLEKVAIKKENNLRIDLPGRRQGGGQSKKKFTTKRKGYQLMTGTRNADRPQVVERNKTS